MSLKEVVRTQDRAKSARDRYVKTRDDLRHAVIAARVQGHTLQEIGDALGMTRQGVYDLLNRKG